MDIIPYFYRLRSRRGFNKQVFFVKSQHFLIFFSCVCMCLLVFRMLTHVHNQTILPGFFLVISLTITFLCNFCDDFKVECTGIFIILIIHIIVQSIEITLTHCTTHDVFPRLQTPFHKIYNALVECGTRTSESFCYCQFVSINTWCLLLIVISIGIHLKVIITLLFAFHICFLIGGVILKVPYFWTTIVPQTFYYTTVLLFTYSVFFKIGSQICRIREQPIQGLKFLPSFFFSRIEQQALRELPMSIVRKNLSGEEHLYILLRATQSVATRKVALDFIIQSHRKRYKSDEKDCVSQLFYRNAVLWYHLDTYTGDTLPNFIQSLSPSFKLLPQKRKLTSYFNSVSYTYPISQQSDFPKNNEKYRTLTTTQQCDNISEASSHWNRPQTVQVANGSMSVANCFTINRFNFEKDFESNVKKEYEIISSPKRYLCTPKHNTARPCANFEFLTQCFNTSSFFNNAINDDNFTNATQQIESYETVDNFCLSETVQTLGENLHISDSFQSILCNNSNISLSEKEQSETLSLPNISSFCNTKHSDIIRREYTLPHIDIQSSSIQSALSKRYSFIKPKITDANSTKIHEQMRHQANIYDQMLKKTIKYRAVPIIANKYFFRRHYRSFKLAKQFNKLLGRASFRLRGIDSIMCNAQWRHTIAIPKCYILGGFVDRKIERWFLSWLSFLQAQQLTKSRLSTSILLSFNFFVASLRFYTLLSKNLNGKNLFSHDSNRNYLFYFISKSISQICLSSILLWFQHPKYLKGSSNAHTFKKYSLFMGILNSGFPLLDAYVEKQLFPRYPVSFAQILFSSITFPTLSQTSVTTNVVFCTILFVCLYFGFFSHNTTTSTHLSYNISVIYIGFLMSFFVLYISRCIMTNYRILFCHYVLPYLLYIDALQPIGESYINDEIMQVLSSDF